MPRGGTFRHHTEVGRTHVTGFVAGEALQSSIVKLVYIFCCCSNPMFGRLGFCIVTTESTKTYFDGFR